MINKAIKNMPIREIGDLLNIKPDKARLIKRLVEGKDKPDKYQSVQDWSKDCHNEPYGVELIMEAINEIMDESGVEAVGLDSAYISRTTEGIYYINRGDTYDQTVIYDFACDKFVINSWGDYVEHHYWE